MTNKEKFLALVSEEKTNTIEKNTLRIKNREMLRESQQIAIKVMKKLDQLGWSQKILAQKLGVRPQQITKIISGKENLTIETQIKLQNILEIPILASFYENRINALVKELTKVVEKIVPKSISAHSNFQEAQIIKMEQTVTAKLSFPIAV